MSIAVSIVSFKPGKMREAREFLESFDAVEAYGASHENSRILILTDIPDEDLEKLCEKINENDNIINVLQHSFYFGE
jgi:nitrate reductase NapAB chaperone NapD